MFGPRGAGASRSSDDLHNEDTFLVADEFGLYAVCDGDGAAPAGEVAAFLAVEAVEYYLEGLVDDGEDEDAAGIGVAEASGLPNVSVRTIEAAMRYALEFVAEAAEERPELAGMQTTMTLLLIQRGRAFVGHTGDSRAHLIRSGRLVQLTTDHEWTSSAASERARPGTSKLLIESFSIPTRQGDTFVLCTDGAEREVANPDLVDQAGHSSPRLLASRIVGAAHRHDPTVDATVVVVRIHEDFEFAWARDIEPLPRDSQAHARAISVAGRRAQSPRRLDRHFARDRVGAGRDPGSKPRATTNA